MSDFLDDMAASSAARAAALPRAFAAAELDKPAFPLRLSCFDVIAEIKDRSPSEGALAQAGASRSEQARRYIEGGAAGISVLTEPSRFSGAVSHLADVAGVAALRQVPVMRKDFLVSSAQLLEAKAAGASGVLLIVAMLSDKTLEDMLCCAYEHSLFVLLESFDEDDLERTGRLLMKSVHGSRAEAAQLLVGVNTRNLRTLEVDAARLEKLGRRLPDGAVAVAESGLGSPADAAGAAGMGYRLALVGTALMRSDDPATLIADMLAAGRARLRP